MTRTLLSHRPIFILGLTLLLLTACNPNPVTTTSTPIPGTPTVTPVPIALTINGEIITQAEFEAQIARYQAAQSALGNTSTLEDATQVVLDDMIEQILLVQGATEMGFSMDDAMLQERIDALVAQVGGSEALVEWIATNGYTEESFRLALKQSIAAAWMRDQIIAAVPSTAEQVHVRQILFYNLNDAQEALTTLKSGYDFDELAALYDPVTKGELGWFPHGYLLEQAFEEAAFALQPGQYSDVIETLVGYHILKVIEREANHPLSPDALLSLQDLALDSWLRDRRSQSTIILAP